MKLKMLGLCLSFVAMTSLVACDDDNGTGARNDEESSSSVDEESSSSVKKSSSSSKVKSSSSEAVSSSSSEDVDSSSSEEIDSSSSVEEIESSSSEETVEKPLCDGKAYDAETFWCYESESGEKLYRLCGGKTFDVATEFCDDQTIVDLCGGKTYVPKESFCEDGVVYPLCKGEGYNVNVNRCENDVLLERCGEGFYDPSVVTCEANVPMKKCYGVKYDITKNACIDGNIVKGCADMDSTTQFCVRMEDIFNDSVSVLIGKCNKSAYKFMGQNPDVLPFDAEYCDVDGVVRVPYSDWYKPRTGGVIVNVASQGNFYYTYKKMSSIKYRSGVQVETNWGNLLPVRHIGGLVWMVQNLTDTTENSSSPNGEGSNDSAYGRLYSYGDAVQACPTGWRWPTKKEILTILDSLDKKALSTNYTNLEGYMLLMDKEWAKTRIGSTGNKVSYYDYTDFGAMPAGSQLTSTSYSGFGNLFEMWASDTSGATVFYIRTNTTYEGVAWKKADVSDNFMRVSVRCVQDYKSVLFDPYD